MDNFKIFFFNLLALLAADYLVKGVEIGPGFSDVLLATVIFTFLNIFIKPILKFAFGPIIIVTFGLGIILVNAAVLYLLDFFSESVKITGLESLFYATLIISFVNLITYFFKK